MSTRSILQRPHTFGLNLNQANLFFPQDINTFGLGVPTLRHKCIGAGYSAKTAERDLELDLPRIENSANIVLNVEPVYFAQAVNKWIDSFYAIQTSNRIWLRYSSIKASEGCTKDNLEYVISKLDATKNRLIARMKKKAIEKGGRLILDRTEVVVYKSKDGKDLRHPAVERYKFIIDKPIMIESDPLIPKPAPIEMNHVPEIITPATVANQNFGVEKLSRENLFVPNDVEDIQSDSFTALGLNNLFLGAIAIGVAYRFRKTLFR